MPTSEEVELELRQEVQQTPNLALPPQPDQHLAEWRLTAHRRRLHPIPNNPIDGDQRRSLSDRQRR